MRGGQRADGVDLPLGNLEIDGRLAILVYGGSQHGCLRGLCFGLDPDGIGLGIGADLHGLGLLLGTEKFGLGLQFNRPLVALGLGDCSAALAFGVQLLALCFLGRLVHNDIGDFGTGNLDPLDLGRRMQIMGDFLVHSLAARLQFIKFQLARGRTDDGRRGGDECVIDIPDPVNRTGGIRYPEKDPCLECDLDIILCDNRNALLVELTFQNADAVSHAIEDWHNQGQAGIQCARIFAETLNHENFRLRHHLDAKAQDCDEQNDNKNGNAEIGCKEIVNNCSFPISGGGDSATSLLKNARETNPYPMSV